MEEETAVPESLETEAPEAEVSADESSEEILKEESETSEETPDAE